MALRVGGGGVGWGGVGWGQSEEREECALPVGGVGGGVGCQNHKATFVTHNFFSFFFFFFFFFLFLF